jgi:hypothetical protein
MNDDDLEPIASEVLAELHKAVIRGAVVALAESLETASWERQRAGFALRILTADHAGYDGLAE